MNKTKELQEALDVLIGLPLRIARRACDMRGFHFGQIRPSKKGTVGDYALHILCSWRLEGPHEILTGHRDLWEPKNEDDWDENWDYEKQENHQDWIIGKLLGGYDPKTKSFVNSEEKLFVESIKIKKFGDLEIFLSGGYKITTFLNHSKGDSWVFFKPEHTEDFFVHMNQDSSRMLAHF